MPIIEPGMPVNLSLLPHRRASWASAAAVTAVSVAVIAAPSSAAASTPPNYTPSLFAGTPGTAGPESADQLNLPFGIVADSAGDVFVSNWIDSTVDEIEPSGQCSVIAGQGTTTPSPGTTIQASDSDLQTPSGLAVNSAGDLFIADEGPDHGFVEEVTPSGQMSVIAGGGSTVPAPGSSIDASSAKLRPDGVAVDSAGNLYIYDDNASEVDEVTGGQLSVIAGNGSAGTTDDGPATGTSVSTQQGNVAVSPSGVVYVADSGNNEISQISNGTLTIVAGNGSTDTPTDTDDATEVGVEDPLGMAFDAAGDLYIADWGNSDSDISELTPGGQLTVIAGNGTANDPTTYGADALNQAIDGPSAVASGPAGQFYIADINNETIDLLAPPAALANTVSPTITGTAEAGDQLTTSDGTWDGDPSSFAYQWQDCNADRTDCTDISDATAST